MYLSGNLGCTKFIILNKNNTLKNSLQIMHLEGVFYGVFQGVYFR